MLAHTIRYLVSGWGRVRQRSVGWFVMFVGRANHHHITHNNNSSEGTHLLVCVEGLSGPEHGGPPRIKPRVARQRVANDQHVVARGVELAEGIVAHLHLLQRRAVGPLVKLRWR